MSSKKSSKPPFFPIFLLHRGAGRGIILEMKQPYTPPESAPILDSLDVITDELMRLKAIEQAAKDFITTKDALDGYSTTYEMHFTNATDYKNLKELVIV